MHKEDKLILEPNDKYRYEKQIEFVLRGVKFLDSLLPNWSLYIDIDILGTYVVGSNVIDQLRHLIVFPSLTIEERIELGFIPLPEFLLTNSVESLWAFCIFVHRRNIIRHKDTIEINIVKGNTPKPPSLESGEVASGDNN